MEMIVDNGKKAITYEDDFKPVKWYVDGNLLPNVSFYDKIITGNPSQFKTEYKKSLINLALKGNTEQKSYEGYNLASVSNDTIIKGQGSVINLGNNIVTIRGIDNSNYTAVYFEIPNPQDLLNKIITLSAKYSSTNTDNRPAIRMIGYNGTSVSANIGTDIYSAAPVGSTAGEITITATVAKVPDLTEYPNGAYCLMLYSNWNGKGNSLGKVTFTNVMLQLGDTVFSYEPYVGGKPSPNDEYPQPINSSGNIELMLSSSEPYIEPTTVTIPIELNKIGDVADELVVDYSAKTVTLIKRIEKFYLKNQIVSAEIREGSDNSRAGIITTIGRWKHNSDSLCTHCKWYAGDNTILSFESAEEYVYLYAIEQSTVEELTQWIESSNIQMALVLDNPIITEYKYELSAPDWVKALLDLSPVRNQTNVITITSDLPISEQNIKYAKWGGADED